jgi:hypothetical protein
MPNDCYCKVRIGAEPDTIKKFCDTEFSFEKLYPCPSNVDSLEWQTEHWGTKWDRYNYKQEHRGDAGLEVKFSTAWSPPTALFQYLAETYHDVWIRCDWSEEGGYAGVFVVHWNEKEKKLDITDTYWNDWCLEEWSYRMSNDDTKSYNHRPRTHCASEDEWNTKESDMAICLTRKERRDLETLVKEDYKQKKGREPNYRELAMDVIRRKANELWPEYKEKNQELIEYVLSPSSPA